MKQFWQIISIVIKNECDIRREFYTVYLISKSKYLIKRYTQKLKIVKLGNSIFLNFLFYEIYSIICR